MEIYNDGQRDLSVAQWEFLLAAVGIPKVLAWGKNDALKESFYGKKE